MASDPKSADYVVQVGARLSYSERSLYDDPFWWHGGLYHPRYFGHFRRGYGYGFAGFGTGLVASGLWLQALPAALVPPLVALNSVAAPSARRTTLSRGRS